MQGVQGQATDSKSQVVSAMELPVETATTMSNPVFQQETDDVRDMEELQ